MVGHAWLVLVNTKWNKNISNCLSRNHLCLFSLTIEINVRFSTICQHVLKVYCATTQVQNMTNSTNESVWESVGDGFSQDVYLFVSRVGFNWELDNHNVWVVTSSCALIFGNSSSVSAITSSFMSWQVVATMVLEDSSMGASKC